MEPIKSSSEWLQVSAFVVTLAGTPPVNPAVEDELVGGAQGPPPTDGGGSPSSASTLTVSRDPSPAPTPTLGKYTGEDFQRITKSV